MVTICLGYVIIVASMQKKKNPKFHENKKRD